MPREDALERVEELRKANAFSGLKTDVLLKTIVYYFEGYDSLKAEKTSAAEAEERVPSWARKHFSRYPVDAGYRLFLPQSDSAAIELRHFHGAVAPLFAFSCSPMVERRWIMGQMGVVLTNGSHSCLFIRL